MYEQDLAFSTSNLEISVFRFLIQLLFNFMYCLYSFRENLPDKPMKLLNITATAWKLMASLFFVVLSVLEECQLRIKLNSSKGNYLKT